MPVPVPEEAQGSRAGRRAIGLETEYLVAFLPARQEPPPWLVLAAVEESILKASRFCDATGGGYFLANGGAVSFESRRERRDNPVLELATPECANAWELLRYVRAQEVLLHTVAACAERSLRRHGFPGRVIFGRSNADWRGEALGCHENYWVKWRDPWPLAIASAAIAFLAAIFCACLDAAFWSFAFVGVRCETSVRRRVRRSRAGRCLAAVAGYGHAAWARTGVPRLAFLAHGLRQAATRAVAAIAGLLLDRVYLRSLRDDLLPFLATRQIFAGAGALVFGEGATPLHLSARARHLRSAGGISLGQRRKAVFDFKPLLREPLSGLRGRKRLCIAGGDSLMAESSLFLSIGSTALVLTMLEEGVSFRDLRLAEPLRAWRSVSAGGPLERARIARGGALRAIDIQQAYLAAARRFFAGTPRGSIAEQVLGLWEGVLGSLEENPAALWGQVDWVTKKALLDRVVFSQAGWKEFGAWGELFAELARCVPRAIWLSALDARTASAFLGPWKRRLFAPLLADADRFDRRLKLHLAAAKIDLGYHEVSRRRGYFEELRRAGDIPCLIDESEAAAAQHEPPALTRAAIRSRAIALVEDPRDLEASWDTLRVNSLKLTVTIRDPLAHLDLTGGFIPDGME